MNQNILAITGSIALLLTGTAAQAIPVQWSSAAGGNDHWYELVFVEGINWFNADAAATSSTYLGMTGHLATITSAEENAFVFGLGVRRTIWLGGVQAVDGVEPDGGWGWVTGETWAYTNWAAVEPTDFGDEEYLAFDDFTDRNGTWNDWNGNNGASGYVIEYEPARVPEPATLGLFGMGLFAFGLARRKARRPS